MQERLTSPASSTVPHISNKLKNILRNLWLFTKDDTPTFVIPNTIFGLCAVLSGQRLIIHTADSSISVFLRVPWVLVFNWSNLLVFDLANQRLEESSREDALNKPWRPVPSGRMTSSQVRQSMLLAIPAVLTFNHYVLHVGTETALLYTLTWLYNDLKGGDESWILRNAIIGLAFGVYNIGSMKVAAATGFSEKVTKEGYIWLFLISGVISTTMHVQDLKDQAGDRIRGRKTAPLVLGDLQARWTLSMPIILWTGYCAYFWYLDWLICVPTVCLALYVSWRCLNMKGKGEDRLTWQLWCMWTAMLYMMPLAS